MKKIVSFCLILGIVMLTSPAIALLGVGVKVSYYSYNDNSIAGFGLDVELPFIPIPLITSRLEVDHLARSGVTLTPILLTGSYKIPLTPVYAGLGLGTVFYSQAGVTVPTTLIYDIFVGYEQAILPMSSGFIQAAYESINFSYNGTNIPTNFSGYSVKGGLRFGI